MGKLSLEEEGQGEKRDTAGDKERGRWNRERTGDTERWKERGRAGKKESKGKEARGMRKCK